MAPLSLWIVLVQQKDYLARPSEDLRMEWLVRRKVVVQEHMGFRIELVQLWAVGAED